MFFLVLSILSPAPLLMFSLPELVIWNVGQGQWVTLKTSRDCFHFDLGGDRAPWSNLINLCGEARANVVALSHWDMDHINFVAKAATRLQNVCIQKLPLGPVSEHKLRLISGIPKCLVPFSRQDSNGQQQNDNGFSQNFTSYISEITTDDIGAPKRHLLRGRLFEPRSSNAMSRVVVALNTLIPGDSDVATEDNWSLALTRLGLAQKIKLLILGHHGSRTSTSELLLKRLPNLAQAVASARFSKYGHPHRETLDRLFKSGVAVIKTETWGHLHFQINPKNLSFL